MMFAPGDLVVCVDDSPCRCLNCAVGIPSAVPVQARSIYRVEDVEQANHKVYLLIVGILRSRGHGRALNATRFRKIDPLADLDTRAAGKTFKLPAKPVLDPARHSRELAK